MNFLKQTQNFTTILDFLRFAVSKAMAEKVYFGHGTDNAWDDMVALIFSCLSLPLSINSSILHAKITEEERYLLCEQLTKRIYERVPVPYLTQEAYFADLSFYVDERVLIPRSPIGELIKQQFAPWVDAAKVKHILDLGTGSGCLAIACCYAFPEAIVDATDISKDAIAVAAINQERHGLHHQLTLMQSDCFSNLPGKLYDIIVSNPPYVGQEELATLPDEYLHEPRHALYAEHNGLAIVEKILRDAALYLSDQGILVVEVGNSEQILIDAYPDAPFTWLEFEHGGSGVFLLSKSELTRYFL